jgi:hypothetical protein
MACLDLSVQFNAENLALSVQRARRTLRSGFSSATDDNWKRFLLKTRDWSALSSAKFNIDTKRYCYL